MRHAIKRIWYTRDVDESITEHIPVLAGTLAERIDIPPDGVIVDATIGQGGHSFLLGKTLCPEAVIIGMDIDKSTVRRAQDILKTLVCKVIVLHANFSEIREQLHSQGIEKVDFILADLGVCSAQLTDPAFGVPTRMTRSTCWAPAQVTSGGAGFGGRSSVP